MRRLMLTLLAVLGVVVLLTGTALAPASTLASSRSGDGASVAQLSGYGARPCGSGGLSWSGNNYPGSGISAWYGPSYPTSAGGGWSRFGQPSCGWYYLPNSGGSYAPSAGAYDPPLLCGAGGSC
jgi:hypothetical protein